MEGFHWPPMQQMAEEHPAYLDSVLAEVRERGPLTVADLEDPRRQPGQWWSWGMGKMALEWHFGRGVIAVRERRGFTRVYDLAERVIPSEHFDADAPGGDEARRELLILAAEAHGIGTARDLADYYRLPIPKSREILRNLAESGELELVEVEGWQGPTYLHPQALRPRRVDTRALISPFDSLIWERDRTERLFGFRYRIEVYVPKPNREYGYYVLPFLLGDNLVGRVDLKADRQAGRLIVRAAHSEAQQDVDHVASELAQELHSMAGWLDLDGIVVEQQGDLAPVLARHVG
jgi:uncharacterized protein YcaQ